MTDTATLQLWLSEATLARHRLVTGAAVASVKYEGKGEVAYTKADLDKLDAYISSLTSQLSADQGTPQTQLRPILLGF